MLRAEDLKDSFWDVRERDKLEEDRFNRGIQDIQSQLDMIRRVQALRHAPGFQDFVTAVQKQHSLAREKLIGDNNLTDQGLREQRGRVKGIESVLALLTRPEIGDTLEVQLAERKNLLAQALNRRPQPRTEEPR